MIIVYFLAFFFFLFITVVVIRKERKLDKVLLAMLLFLQLAALSMAVHYILNVDDAGKSFTYRQYNSRFCTKFILSNVCAVLFL